MLHSVTKFLYWHAYERNRKCQIEAKQKCYRHPQEQWYCSFIYILSRAEGYPPKHGWPISSEFLFTRPTAWSLWSSTVIWAWLPFSMRLLVRLNKINCFFPCLCFLPLSSGHVMRGCCKHHYRFVCFLNILVDSMILSKALGTGEQLLVHLFMLHREENNLLFEKSTNVYIQRQQNGHISSR